MVEHKNPSHTVDAIIEFRGKVLLVARKNEPYAGKLAFPGGFVDYGEKIEDAVVREAKEETGLGVLPIEILGVYSDPKRDPRRHTITTVFICTPTGGQLKAGDDALDAQWYSPIDLDAAKMSFDHWRLFNDFLRWKKKPMTFWSSKR